MAQNAERLTRFEREAKVLASLNHPNIAQIYGVEENALVMELVAGSTLSVPQPLPTALAYARQIAEALEVAHEKGIIHRDLKPSNIMITTDGVVKVLDFGLASVPGRESGEAVKENSPTMTMAATQAGTIMGTAAYMSPEQAAGKATDKRSDIWSFGVVLWEMLTGAKLFDGETISHTLADVLRSPIDFGKLPASIPAPIIELLQRCLDRDPKTRLRDIGEARVTISRYLAKGTAGFTVQPAAELRPVRSIPSWIVAAAFAVGCVIASTGWYRASRPAEPKPLARLSLDLGPDAVHSGRQDLAISPDGTRVAFLSRGSGGSRISLLSLNESKATPVVGTEDGQTPFFSPDGQWLGFSASGKLLKVSLRGGPPIILCASVSPFTGASWGQNGTIVASLGTQTGFSVVPDSGGALQPLTRPVAPEATHRWPQFLPGGDLVLFTSHTLLDDFDDANLQVVSVKSGKVKTILKNAYFGRYLTGGFLIYLHDGILYGVRFDLDSLAIRGTAKPLLDDIAVSTAWGTGSFAFSDNGVFIYRRPVMGSWPLAWMDSLGKTEPLLPTPRPYYTPRLSPDGTKLAVSEGGVSHGNIVVFELARQKTTEITNDGQGHFSPVWTPDGKHLIYRSHNSASGEYGLDWAPVDGSSSPRRLLSDKKPLLPSSISPDGRNLAYVKGDTGYDVWTLPIDISDPDHPRAGEPAPFATTPANELEPAFSPDGRWLAYASNEAHKGRTIFVRPFPPPKYAPDRKWAVSSVGGGLPIWSRSGRELFYVDAQDNRILRVRYSVAGDSFIAQPPEVWSPQSIFRTELYSCLDLSPDGRRFAVIPNPDPRDDRDATGRLTLLQNFFDEVHRRIPASEK